MRTQTSKKKVVTHGGQTKSVMLGANIGPKVWKPYGSASGNFVFLGAAGGSSAFISEEMFLVEVFRTI